MNYAEMTDSEINKAVSKYFKNHVFLNIFGEPVSLEPDPAATYTGKDFDEVPFDPCNSWADAGTIIAENQISIIFDADSMIDPPAHWVTCRYVSDKGDVSEHYGKPDRPLRAAMITFLMMQDNKDEQ